MLEVWIQYTCNGCGCTENDTDPYNTKGGVRKELREHGWRSAPGNLDYCPQCVKNGNYRRRETSMNE